MIEIKNLHKRYPNSNDFVLEDVSITIPTGVSVGILGHNGAGKSTLLRMIGGIEHPEQGEIITDSSISPLIGISNGLQTSLTGRQNTRLFARFNGMKNKLDEIVEYVERFAELGEQFDKPVKGYSSGMKSRLSFGISLAFNFDVYLSDEATAVGDFLFKRKATNEFKKRIGQSSLIIVSHSEGILRDLCQAGVLIKDKKAHWYDSIDEAINAYHTGI